MPTIDWVAVDLPNYVKDAQPYIKSVIEDPRSIPTRLMDDVTSTIVNRAWEDPGYHVTAAIICQVVVQKEFEQQAELCIPKYTFRTSLIESCQLLVRDWQKMRAQKITYWINFCRFMGEVHLRVRVTTSALTAFGMLMINILTYLASETCVQNFEEVDLLCSLFHDCGEDLNHDHPQAFDAVMTALRDIFISSRTDKSTQGLILPLIELYASNFRLSEDAKNFYFHM